MGRIIKAFQNPLLQCKLYIHHVSRDKHVCFHLLSHPVFMQIPLTLAILMIYIQAIIFIHIITNKNIKFFFLLVVMLLYIYIM